MEELTTEEQSSQGLETNTAGIDAGGSAPAEPKTVNVLGRDYDLSDPDQVWELTKDYDRLGRMYSPLNQRIAELEGLVQKQAPQKENYSDPETVEYLSKLGFVSREELSRKEEDRNLEITIQGLEKSIDGKDGRPKFDRRAVLEFCIQNGISNPEHGYNLLNWNALKEWELRQAKSAPIAPPSSGGEGGQRDPQSKKRVFGSVGEGQVSVREAMLETLEKESPTSIA